MLLCQKTSYRKKLSTGQVSNLSDALYLAEVFEQLSPLGGLSLVCPFCHLCQDPVWIAVRAAVTNDHKLSGSKQQNFELSHFRRPEVQNQAVPWKTWILFRSSQRESVPCPSPSFWWLPAVLGVPRLAAAWIQSLSPHGILLSVGVCLCF